jgi:hypothetical protein
VARAEGGSVTIKPSLGTRLLLAGVVLVVAGVVGMLTAPALHALFHSYIGVAVPIAILAMGWSRVARVRACFTPTGIAARNTWRSFNLAWAEVDRLDDATCYLAQGPKVYRVQTPTPHRVLWNLFTDRHVLEATARFKDEPFIAIHDDLARRYKPRFTRVLSRR